jgi:excisionase family DNA binding protein
MKFDEVPKMATIKETAKIFNLPEYFVRQLVKNGQIVAVQSGRKTFINLNKFAEKLNVGNISADEEEKETVIGIRPIH